MPSRDVTLATVPPEKPTSPSADSPPLHVTGNGRDASGVKAVPQTAELREQIRRRADELAARLDRSRPLSRHEMETHARQLLDGLRLPETYLGWTMVALASGFWHDQVAAVPYHRRLLLLPRCLRDEEICPAEYDEMGLLCQDCGACPLSGLRAEARRKGYRTLIAEGSPAVMKIILAGDADALLGVACLDVLEKTFDKILLAGIPSMAIPLLCNGCSKTTVEIDRVHRLIETPHRPAEVKTRTYLHLMRCAAQMFEPAELARLVPRSHCDAVVPETGGDTTLAEMDGDGPAIDELDPIACTEAIAYDFLRAGGKHSRPFITLAVYDALDGGAGTSADGARQVAQIPDTVKRMALAIEIFHKASLVHDDIEDGDAFRYGRPALHNQYGAATAINIGDFLIGLGYRLVASQRDALPAEVIADVTAQFARAHTKLCEGQGAELIWRDARQKRLSPLDALKIYALKTSPAFEAALLAGVRLAGPVEPYREAIARYSRHLGVAYQIINDLDDWQDNQPNKRVGGGDVLGGRPTVLLALALQELGEQDRCELLALVGDRSPRAARTARVGELYARAEVYRKASTLISKHHRRAQQAADQLDNEPLRRLLHFILDAILDRRPLAISETKAQ